MTQGKNKKYQDTSTRESRVSFRLYEHEERQLTKEGEALGLPLSSYIRYLLSTHPKRQVNQQKKVS